MISIEPTQALADALNYASEQSEADIVFAETAQERADILGHQLELNLLRLHVLTALRRKAIGSAAP